MDNEIIAAMVDVIERGPARDGYDDLSRAMLRAALETARDDDPIFTLENLRRAAADGDSGASDVHRDPDAS